jgi:hypothetical protein
MTKMQQDKKQKIIIKIKENEITPSHDYCDRILTLAYSFDTIKKLIVKKKERNEREKTKLLRWFVLWLASTC